MERRDEDAAVVEDGGRHLLRRRLPFLLVHLPDLVQHRVVGADTGELHRVVALGRREAAGGVDVGLGRAPHERHDLAERIAHALELLDRHRGGAAEQVPDHEVRAVALGDVEHLGAHLHTRRRDGERLELKPFFRREVLEHFDGLAPGGVVVEDVRDLLALEAPAELLLHEVHRRRALRPVGGGNREDIRVPLTVGGGGAPEARRGAGNPILCQPLGERVDLGRAVDGDGHGAFLLVALVGLHGRRYLVFVVDLQSPDLVALDPALAVHEGDVVVEAGAQDRSDDLRRSGPVALHTDDDLALRLGVGGSAREQAARRHDQRRHDDQIVPHEFSFHHVPQYANGQTRK